MPSHWLGEASRMVTSVHHINSLKATHLYQSQQGASSLNMLCKTWMMALALTSIWSSFGELLIPFEQSHIFTRSATL